MKARLLAAFVASSASQAFAADAPTPCPLQEAVSLDMITETDGAITVPAKLNGKPFIMEVDTGSPYTSIKSETAEELGLPLELTLGSIFMNNVRSNEMANLNSLALGKMEIAWPVLVTPNFIRPWQAGLLGQDVIRSFDIEFDYYHSKLNLFLHNTCTTDAAYWTHGSVAVVPFEVNRDSHITVDAILDGKKVTALIDTGSESSSMSIDSAQDIFDIRDNDPRLKSVRQENINGGGVTTISAFPFSTLNFEGVAISNPQIDLIPKKNFDERRADVILGANVLRRLRMYIAYSQNKIYLTGAKAK